MAPNVDPAEVKAVADQLLDALGENIVRIDAPLGALTTYRVGGRCSALITPLSIADLERAKEVIGDANIPLLPIGRGSNMLVADRGFVGIAIQLSGDFDDISTEGATLRAGGGAALPIVARRSVAAGLAGMEWAVGIPGSVGGAVRMNAGGHGSVVSDTVYAVELFSFGNGRTGRFGPEDFDFSYRHSNVTSNEIVTAAEFVLIAGDPVTGESRLDAIVSWRRMHQPGGQNAGSFFRNPPGQPAGLYIDHAGFKNFKIGTAYVNEKHANFIQATDDGSADDVYAVMREVQKRVREKDGIELEPEVVLVGFEDVQ